MKILNLPRVLRTLDGYRSADLRSVMAGAVAVMEAQAKLLAPVDTGLLRSSIHPAVDAGPGSVRGSVYASADYAAHVEFGTGPAGSGTYPYPDPPLT